MPTAKDFKHELFRAMAEAQNAGNEYVEINAGKLHRLLGGYARKKNRMSNCCQVMKGQLDIVCGDVILGGPPSGQGPTLTIRYLLPRRQRVKL